jgi:hypothetical protein
VLAAVDSFCCDLGATPLLVLRQGTVPVMPLETMRVFLSKSSGFRACSTEGVAVLNCFGMGALWRRPRVKGIVFSGKRSQRAFP